MTRGIRQMSLAGMSDLALAAMRESVARAAAVSGDPDHLIEDIDAELARRVPAKETS